MGSSLLRGKGPECGEHGQDDGAGVIKEYAYDLSDNFSIGLGEGGRGVYVLGILHLLPALELGVGVRLILWFFGGNMVETFEGGMTYPSMDWWTHFPA